MVRRSLMLATGILIGLALAAASAQAQRTLTMSGQWFQNRGPLVDIPLNGGPVGCAGGPQTGCVGNLRPLDGGIPATSEPVAVTGTGPAAFSIANSAAFARPGGSANRQTVPVNGIPTVIQLASQFSAAGPGLTSMAGGPATFQSNAWSQDPGQAARLGPNFTWCPPGGACATPTYGNPLGAYNAQIRYTAGTNGFGGTMAMMLRDTAVVSINLGGSPPQVLHQLVGGTNNTVFAPQMGGAGYAAARTLVLAPGPIHASYQIGTPCTTGIGQEPMPPGCGVITAQGSQVGTQPSSTIGPGTSSTFRRPLR